MKKALRNLLNRFIEYEPDAAVQADIAYFEDALDAGVFDCLVRHPSSEPPDTTRRVLVSQYGLWHIGQYKHTSPPYKRRLWHVAGVCTVEMLEWRELPPGVTK